MIVSEQEARTKWCPHARVQAHQAGVNRGTGYGPGDKAIALQTRCVASECMAWKWKQYHSPEEREDRKRYGFPAPEAPLGYCGL